MPGRSLSRIRRGITWVLGLTALAGQPGFVAVPAFGDEFGRITGAVLFDIPARGPGQGTAHLGARAIESLPEVVRGERSPLVIATTDKGNVAKLLISSGLLRSGESGKKAELVPVISLDRFETLDAGDRVSRKAHGRDVLLFDGFEFDLDSGRVVPPGFGGDLRFAAHAQGGAELTALGKNLLYPIDKPIPLPGISPGRPSPGPAVVPGDFSGRYTLIANGQTSGALEVTVDEGKTVTGRFRSDRNGAIYPVSGTIAADLPRRIEFEIKFPRSRQVFDGLLWTQEKNVFAGTVLIQEHPYSFVAVREGSSWLPETIEATSPPRLASVVKTLTRVVVLDATSDRYTLGGVARTPEELTAALSPVVKADPAAAVLLRVPKDTPFERVQRATRLIREAGVATIRLAPAGPIDDPDEADRPRP